MQADHSGAMDEPLLLWAIAANGSILRRVGVTGRKPQGETWEAVISEHAFQSISIGADRRVWAITSLGIINYINITLLVLLLCNYSL